jgi:anti-sigma-K factor RskA
MNVTGRLLRRDPHSLAAPYALNALDAAERRDFEAHLDRCQKCAADVRLLAGAAARLAGPAATAPPAGLRDRVLAAVATTPQEPRPVPDAPAAEPVRPRPVRVRLLVPVALGTAAVAVAAAVLFAVRAGSADDRLDQARAQARAVAQVLAAPDARSVNGRDAQGRGIGLVTSARQGRAVVTVTGLAAPPSGHVHQLWLTRPGRPAVSLGLLDGDAPLVATGLTQATAALAVTTEPAGGSRQPTTPPLTQLALVPVESGT